MGKHTQPERVLAGAWDPGFFYGWVVLGVATVAAFMSGPGQTFGVSAFIESYVLEFQWTRSEVSFLYLVGTCASATLQTSLGLAIDSLGPRQSLIIFSTCLSMACYFNGTLVTDKLSLAFGFFLVRLFGQGGMSLVPKTVVPRWFVRRRGIAMGLLSVGWMVSQAVLPAVNATLIAGRGYRAAWTFWAGCVLLMVPIAAAVMVDSPQDIHQTPDGDPPTSTGHNDPQSPLLPVDNKAAAATATSRATGSARGDLTPAEVIRTLQFYALAFIQLEGALVHTAVTFHAFGIVGRHTAPHFLAARSAVGFPTNLLAGWCVDRVGGRSVMLAGFVAQAVGFALLTAADGETAGAEWVASTAGGLLGAASALVNIAFSTIIPSSFGVTNLGAINGLFSSVGVFGSAVGPWVYGVSADTAGTWRGALWASAAAATVCAAVTRVLAHNK